MAGSVREGQGGRGVFDAWCPDRADSRADPSVNEIETHRRSYT